MANNIHAFTRRLNAKVNLIAQVKFEFLTMMSHTTKKPAESEPVIITSAITTYETKFTAEWYLDIVISKKPEWNIISFYSSTK